MKQFNKTVLATMLLAGISPAAFATMTQSAGQIIGTVPIIKASAGAADHSVAFSNNHASGSITGMSPGDKISLDYILADAEGDADKSDLTIKWFTTTDGVGADRKDLGVGIKDYIIQAADAGRYIGAEITEETATGIPTKGQTLIITDISNNDNADNIPDGPVVGGTVATSIVDSAAPTVNLIGAANSELKVGHTYQFNIWYDVNNNGIKDANELDASDNYTYKWVLDGTSATRHTPGGYAVSTTDNKDLTIPATNVEAKNIFASADLDGVQGYGLKVDYTAKVKAVRK